MQKTFLVASLFIIVSFASITEHAHLSSMWDAWKIQHTKSYSILEEPTRFNIFVHNYNKITKFNAENDAPQLGLNKFADLTASEFKNTHASCSFCESDQDFIRQNTRPPQDVEALPTTVDWRNKGAVTSVKNQGQCGSCWAFSATGALEGQYFINNQKLLSFSEQQIIDCDEADSGCNGGYPYNAIKYASKNGMELESEYPYTAQDGTCAFNKSKANKVSTGYQFIPANSTAQLKNALVKQPVSVLIEADQEVFQLYKSGVIKANCGANLDLAALVVGYTKVGLLEAFIVKNNWGPDWGEQGYVYIWDQQTINHGQGVCGILGQPVVPIN